MQEAAFFSALTSGAGSLAPGKAVLLVNGDRIMGLCLYATAGQVIQHAVSIGGIDRFDLIQMEYMPVARADVGELDEIAIRQAGSIFPGDLNPAVTQGGNV